MAIGLDEVYTQIRTIGLADSTLTGMLASATAWYYGADIATSPSQPFIRAIEVDDGQMQQDSFQGDGRPRLQVDIVGTDPSVLYQIRYRLDELFWIPQNRTSHIETAHFRVRRMQRAPGGGLIKGTREEDGLTFQQLVTEWILTVTKKDLSA